MCYNLSDTPTLEITLPPWPVGQGLGCVPAVTRGGEPSLILYLLFAKYLALNSTFMNLILLLNPPSWVGGLVAINCSILLMFFLSKSYHLLASYVSTELPL